VGINHDIFSSGGVAFTTTASGTFINETAGGTGAPVFAGNHDYHAAAFFGTLGNNGSVVVYGHFNSTGGGTTTLGSVSAGSANGIAAFDFRTDALLALGTVGAGTYFTHYSAQIVVPAGGTWRGALVLVDYNARTAGTTPAAVGISALGTRYA